MSLQTIVNATVVFAIAFSGMVAWGVFANRTSPFYVPLGIGFTLPIRLPLALIGFAIGRKELTTRFVVVMAIAEGLAVWFAQWLQENN
jgi:uncharacterized membrane protein YgaE (UPF0421/DUF939 family)